MSENKKTSKKRITLNTAKDMIFADLLSAHYYKQELLVNYIEGTMGIGKSSIFRQLRKHMAAVTGSEWGLIDLRLATLSASDLQGIPFAVKLQNGLDALKWLKDSSLPGIGEHPKHGIVLLDEINQVEDNSVLSLMYQLILDRKINDYTIPDGWHISCAGNREEDGGVYNRLPAPVRDRMSITEVWLPTGEWLDYAVKSRFHPAVVSFVRERDANGKNVLHTYNAQLEADGDSDCENYVFATPRTWEEVGKTLYSHENMLEDGGQICATLTRSEVLDARICGKLGDSMGTEFSSYYKQTRDIPISDILKADWRNNEPSIKLIQSLKNQQDSYFLTAMMSSLTVAEMKYKILAFAAYVNVNKNTFQLLMTNLTEVEKKGFVNYMTINNCPKLLMNASITVDKDSEIFRV